MTNLNTEEKIFHCCAKCHGVGEYDHMRKTIRCECCQGTGTMPTSGIEALRQSIKEKWYDLFFKGFTNKRCSLCNLFHDSRYNDCVGCPILLHTRLNNCSGTPYWDYRNHLYRIHQKGDEYGEVSHDCCHEFIRKEILFLFKVLREERKRQN